MCANKVINKRRSNFRHRFPVRGSRVETFFLKLDVGLLALLRRMAPESNMLHPKVLIIGDSTIQTGIPKVNRT